MRNFIQTGNTLTAPAPYNVLSGGGLLIGAIFGVAAEDALNGANVDFDVVGVFTLPKTSALAISYGDKVYWDNIAKVVNKTAGGNTYIGVAVSTSVNPSGFVDVRLNGSF